MGRAIKTAYSHPAQTLGGLDQPFRFTGQLRDTETGFYDLRARLYDPSTGRFTSRDPMAGFLADPSSLNRYVYAGNNPVTLTDPSGSCVGPLVAACAFVLANPEVVAGAVAVASAGAPLILAQQTFADANAGPQQRLLDNGLLLLSLVPGGESAGLIGVPEDALATTLRRLIGLRVGDRPVIYAIDAFGSRAGSVYRGRGPLSSSDLDILIITDRTLMEGRSGPWIKSVLDQIAADFEREAGFRLNIARPDIPGVFRSNIRGSPWIRLFER